MNPLSLPGTAPPRPVNAFQITEKKREELQQQIVEQEEEKPEKEKWIRCRNCGHRITSPRDRIEMNGRHQHVFNNPAGFVFEIGCFGAADGCAGSGQPTLEFTWFSGYNWRFAICSGCHTHLGWLYQSTGGNSFYGLILNQLVEDT